MLDETQIKYCDGDFSVATAIGPVKFDSPFPGVADTVDFYGNDIQGYLLTQKFMQFLKFFEPLAMNTQHPDYEYYGLVTESPRQEMDGGIYQWTRVYAARPVNRIEGSTLSYQYPALIGAYTAVGGAVTPYNVRSIPQTISSNVKLLYEYFVIGTGAGGQVAAQYTDPTLVPVIQKQYWYQPIYSGSSYVGNEEVSTLTPVGYSAFPTVPSTDLYLVNRMSGAFTLQSENSQLSRWQGNIWQRVSKLIQWL